MAALSPMSYVIRPVWLVDLARRQPDIAVVSVIGVEVTSSITAVRAGLGHWWRAVHSVVYRVVLGVVLGVGVAGVVRVWAFDRGFWNDELYLAVNLKAKSVVGLSGPLIHLQTAPPGWLAGERIIYLVFGGQERLLNLPQLLAAVAVLVLTAVIACRAVGRWAAVIATMLVAGSPSVYYYAGELKQYEVEAAGCLVVIVAAGMLGRAAMAGALTRKEAVIAGAMMLTATAVSYTALIVAGGAVGGVLLTLALTAPPAQRWRATTLVGLAACPALAYGVFQVLRRLRFPFAREQAAYFPNGLAPQGSGPLQRVAWLPRLWQGFVANPMQWRLPVAVAALSLAGIVALIVRGRLLWAAIVVGVTSAAVVAAAVRAFPMEDRVALYLFAPYAIAVAAGIDGLVRAAVCLSRKARRVPTAAAAVAAVVASISLIVAVAPAAQTSYTQVRQPVYRDPIREVVIDVAARIKAGDAVLWYAFTQPAADWYGEQYSLPTIGLISIGPECGTELRPLLSGAKRVWYLRGVIHSAGPPDLHAHVLAELSRLGRLEDSRVYGTGTILGPAPGWALIDLTTGPDPHPPTPKPFTDPRFRCVTATSQWRT